MRIIFTVAFLLLIARGFSQNVYPWTTFTTSNSGITGNLVTQLYYVGNDSLWIGTSNGLNLAQNLTISPVPNFPATWVNTIFRNNTTATLWVGTCGNGLFRLNADGSFTNFTISNTGGALGDDCITAIAQDADTLWIGTETQGLYAFINGNWQNYNSQNTPNNLPINAIRTIQTDPAGNKWIGTRQGGLFRLARTGVFTQQSFINGLPFDDVTSLLFKNNGPLWLGFAGNEPGNHFSWIDPVSFAITNLDTIQTAPTVTKNCWDLFTDHRNRTWIATNAENEAVIIYNDTLFTSFGGFDAGLLSNRVYDIAQDDSLRMWLATFNGVSVNVSTQLTGMAPAWQTASALHVYPNPVSDWVQIEFPKENNPSIVWVYALNGQLLNRFELKPYQAQLNINTSDWIPGVYIINWQTQAQTHWAKIIKQ